MTPLGTVPASGQVDVTVQTHTKGADAGAYPLGCLDRTALDAAVRHLTATGATAVRPGGHTIGATLPAPTGGTAVIATTAVPGWQCSAPLKPFHGVLAVDLPPGTTEVSCTFTPKGLAPGLAGAALSLLTLAAVHLTTLRRRRRRLYGGNPLVRERS